MVPHYNEWQLTFCIMSFHMCKVHRHDRDNTVSGQGFNLSVRKVHSSARHAMPAPRGILCVRPSVSARLSVCLPVTLTRSQNLRQPAHHRLTYHELSYMNGVGSVVTAKVSGGSSSISLAILSVLASIRPCEVRVCACVRVRVCACVCVCG